MTQTWNPAQKETDVSLSGGNLIATMTVAGPTYACVFALNGVSSGFYYWEQTPLFGVGSASDVCSGIGNTTSTFGAGNALWNQSTAVGWFPTAKIFSSSAQLATWATYSSGDVLGFALDLTNQKLWGRVGAAGNWNNDVIGNQNPATNTGGLAVPAGVSASPIVPAANLFMNTQPDSVTAAFALGSWAGVAPSGFGPFDVVTVLAWRARPVSFFR